jgi:DNA-binding CsgD family transcriptional regulator
MILLLALPYSTVLIFPAFGPVLEHSVGPETAPMMSSWFLLFLIAGFCIKPFRIFSNKLRSTYIAIFTLFTALFTSFFLAAPDLCKWIILALFGICIGRIGLFWSCQFVTSVPAGLKGRIIGLVLFVSYGFLYVMNVATTLIPPYIALLLVSLILLTSGILFMLYGKRPVFQSIEKNDDIKINGEERKLPLWPLLVIFLIFITAGITHSGIYRTIAAQFAQVDRYYNVLPFVIAVPFAGLLSDIYGRHFLIYTGIACLGVSFICYLFLPGLGVYFLMQTSLQIGWAFMNTFAWLIGADIGSQKKKPSFLAFTVATFLAGTFTGSVLVTIFSQWVNEPSSFVALTHLPLFASLLFIGKLSRKHPTEIEQSFHNVQYSNKLKGLTLREKEIFHLLLQGETRKEIVSTLHITENTIKTHSRNIYKKLQVKNKHELSNIYEYYLN